MGWIFSSGAYIKHTSEGVLQSFPKAVLLGKLSLMFEDDHELKTASRSRPTDPSPAGDLQAMNDDKRFIPKVAGTEQNCCVVRTGGRLSVVRERDSDLSAMCAGRMTISGRFSDVCAELDRMERLGQHAVGYSRVADFIRA